MLLPRHAADGILKITRATEVLDGLSPLLSNSQSKSNELIIERYEIEGRVTTPRVGFENQHLVAINWKGQVKEIGGAFRSISAPRAIQIFPVGLAVEAQILSGVEFTNLSLKPAFLRRVACETDLPNRCELVPQWGIRDEQIEGLAFAAESEIRSDGRAGNLFIESLATALAAHVLARFSSQRVELRQYRGGISRTQVGRTEDFIEAHLGEDFGLAELAANVGMSRYHFCRLFNQSTNLSPHQFVIRRRVERAQQLLKDHRLTMAEIATNLGFSDQSHFARVFRRLVGTTPKRYASEQ
jgi:AraC family transcriptional regulator